METRFIMCVLATTTIIILGLLLPYLTHSRLKDWACQNPDCGRLVSPRNVHIGTRFAQYFGVKYIEKKAIEQQLN